MKPSLQLRVSQSLTMTPQLQQAIRLLQLSSIELQNEVQDALESNMMLEVADEENNRSSDDDNNSSDSKSASGESKSDSSDNSDVGDTTLNEEISGNKETIPDDLPVDSEWDDIYDGSSSYSKSSDVSISSQNLFENQDSGEKTLHEHLLWQLNLTPTSETDKAIAVAVIDSLDDDGYLTSSNDEILNSLAIEDEEIDESEIEAVVRMIQAMDPVGVAARNLQECLLLQLKQQEAGTQWLDEALDLVENHLDSLGSRNFNLIMRRMKLSQEELQQVIHLIQTMNPKPGGSIQESRTEYVVPDVFVKKIKGVWKVELNMDAIPQVRINSSYASMIRRADNSADNNSLKSHLQEARWFIKSLQSRSETLLKVATAIVERQRGFLEYGEEAMKPLVLHDIAETLGMHESTISRVTTRKYMHTPRGIFELKYFFSSHVSTNYGGACSSTAIRALIKKLISAETPNKPLSDNKIAALLDEQGINVARRTVAKYREAMSIPPSNERKRLS